MECTPLNINVVLVSPGKVKSNLAVNQHERVGLPEDSLYKDYIDSVIAKLNASQSGGPMPATVFAQKVTSGVLQARPPRYMTLAPMSGLFKFLQWLPRGWVLRTFWRKLGEGLKKAPQK